MLTKEKIESYVWWEKYRPRSIEDIILQPTIKTKIDRSSATDEHSRVFMSIGKKVLVCGAGWAGMHAAQLLQEAGYIVKVLEKAGKPGGRIKSDVLNGFIIDHGFQVINPSYAELKESRALAGIDFYKLPKAVDIRMDTRTIRMGDPRQNLGYLKVNVRN